MDDIRHVTAPEGSASVHAVCEPQYTRSDERGVLTEIMNSGLWGCALMGEMAAGAVLGNHYHKNTAIYFHLLSGAVLIRTINIRTRRRDAMVLAAGSGVHLPAGESHAIRFVKPSSFLMLKSQSYDPDQPDTYPYPVS